MKKLIQIAVAMAAVFSMTGCGGGTCERVDAANKKFFAGKSECAVMGGLTLKPGSSTVSTCNASISKCTAADQTILDNYTKCIEAAPACTTGNEKAAADAYTSCIGQILTISASGLSYKLSADCSNGFK